MNCTFRVAGKDEIERMIELRMEFIREFRPEYSKERLGDIERGSTDFIREKIAQGLYTAFFGEEDGQIVCAAAFLFYDYPPISCEKPRRIGHVLNFYTRKPYRRQGLGRALMQYLLEYARENGLAKVDLDASEDGYPLYLECGFKTNDRYMHYVLNSVPTASAT